MKIKSRCLRYEGKINYRYISDNEIDELKNYMKE
jgi:hypothetical protein